MKNLFKKQSARFVQNPSSFTKVMVKHILVCFFMPHSVLFAALRVLLICCRGNEQYINAQHKFGHKTLTSAHQLPKYCRIVEFVGWCIMELVIKAQNNVSTWGGLKLQCVIIATLCSLFYHRCGREQEPLWPNVFKDMTNNWMSKDLCQVKCCQ